MTIWLAVIAAFWVGVVWGIVVNNDRYFDGLVAPIVFTIGTVLFLAYRGFVGGL